MKAARGELEKQISTITAERDALNGRLVTIQIDQGVTTAATKRGLRATSIPDITSRARSVFRLVNGVPTAFEADGQTVRPGKDGVTPMTLEEWIDAQVSEAPHLFESPLPARLNPGQKVRVRQRRPGATSNWAPTPAAVVNSAECQECNIGIALGVGRHLGLR